MPGWKRSTTGLWAAASPKYRHLTDGFELADSWATDAHKWPNVGYDSGIAIVRDGDALRNSMIATAAYLDPSARREPLYHTPDSSRRARGVELWAALKSLGKSGLADLIERTCAHAQKSLAVSGVGFRPWALEFGYVSSGTSGEVSSLVSRSRCSPRFGASSRSACLRRA